MMKNRGMKGLLALLLISAQKLRFAPEGFPAVDLRPFDSMYKGTYTPSGKRRARVAYFAGCATNTMDTQTGISVMKVLACNDIEVVVPPNLVCCGIPALGEGDIKTVQKSVRTNVNILSALDVDAIITDCTSCGMMLRVEAPKTLPEDDPHRSQASQIAGKVFEVTDFLNTVGICVEPGPLDESYTYHVPCHSGWTLAMNNAPVQLLRHVHGLKYKAMDEPEKCCGAGGTFFMNYADLSRKIRQRKADDIINSGARVVVSQCPGCRSYLSPILNKGQETVHPVTLLRRSYRC
jgi:glycolate oxidase iron-sulfur subunit